MTYSPPKTIVPGVRISTYALWRHQGSDQVFSFIYKQTNKQKTKKANKQKKPQQNKEERANQVITHTHTRMFVNI